MFFNKLLKPAVLTIACAAALTAGSFGNVSFFHEAHAQTSQLSGLPDFTKSAKPKAAWRFSLTGTEVENSFP